MTDLTIDEAAAWLAGVAEAARTLRQMAGRIRDSGKGCPITEANAATLELAADALAELDVPPMPDGLCGRGA